MSQSATPATQNDMTTCLETFEKERFCGFPHRHGEATREPETRDVSCEASVNFQHIAQNATLATEFAPCRHLTQPCQCDVQKHATRHVESAAPATKNDDGHVQSAAPATKTATHLLKTSQKYCACHAKRLSTRCRTRLNVTKCHACHAKQRHIGNLQK